MNKTVHEGIGLIIQRYNNDLYEYWCNYSPIKESRNYIHDLNVVNIFLNNQLKQLNLSVNYQIYLMENHNFNEWIVNFEKQILPILLHYGIPYFNELGYEPKGK